MDLTFQYRVKGSSSIRKLNQSAQLVNTVWNWANDQQRSAVLKRKFWLDTYDLINLSSGGCREMDLGSETIQAVCEKYVTSRKTAKKPHLRYRGRRSLGWVPFKARGIKFIPGRGLKFRNHLYKIWLSRPIPGKIKCGSFTRDNSGNWYVNVCVAVDNSSRESTNRKVGIDLGLSTLATLSNGVKYQAIPRDKLLEDKLKICWRANNMKRFKAIHRKIRRKRNDNLHKITSAIVNEYDFIVVGDIKCRPLAKTGFASSATNVSWGVFRNMLRYKTIASGAKYKQVSEYQSSQLCSSCGSLPDSRPRGIAQLRIREWACTTCGQGHDRDINAARNILALGCERPAEGIVVKKQQRGHQACRSVLSVRKIKPRFKKGSALDRGPPTNQA